jgi:tRNA A37 threonylcarbamoyladenosine synthetase subunit TsaC/SUA5/YrdC
MDTGQAARQTSDPVAPEQLERDVAALLDTLEAGGVGIAPLDVAYAILATTPAGLERIFAAKQRSWDKPSGLFADWRTSRELHLMDAARHDMVRSLVEEERVPFSVVAPFRTDHKLVAAADPFVIRRSTKAGTMDMLLNAGPFHDALAAASRARGMLVFGSSANRSLSGSKYRYEDIDEAVRAAADIHVDYGVSRYANPDGLSSTIIDFRDFTVVRAGVCFERLRDAFKTRFGVALKA